MSSTLVILDSGVGEMLIRVKRWSVNRSIDREMLVCEFCLILRGW